MDSHDFDLEAYLQRIRFGGWTDVSLDTLARLHRAHFHTIPFENFDILLGRGIDEVIFNPIKFTNSYQRKHA